MSEYVPSFPSHAVTGETERERYDYSREVSLYFAGLFPERASRVFKADRFQPVGVDVTVLYPTEEEPFYFLYTTGMSGLSMAEYLGGAADDACLAELYMMLPGDWPFSAARDVSADTADYPWPVRFLADVGRFPHENGMWLSYGFVLPTSERYVAFSDAVLLQFDGELGAVRTDDGKVIQLFMPMPLYAEEADLYGKIGPDELTERVLQCNKGSFFVNPQRPNAAKA